MERTRQELAEPIQALKLTDSEAVTVFHILKDGHEWGGGPFTKADIETSIDGYLDCEEEAGEEFTAEERQKILDFVLASEEWNDGLDDASDGNNRIDDAVRDAVEALNLRGSAVLPQ